MSKKFTTVSFEKHEHNGFSFHGTITSEEATRQYREHAGRMVKSYTEALALLDSGDYRVTQHTGLHVWRGVKELPVLREQSKP